MQNNLKTWEADRVLSEIQAIVAIRMRCNVIMKPKWLFWTNTCVLKIFSHFIQLR